MRGETAVGGRHSGPGEAAVGARDGLPGEAAVGARDGLPGEAAVASGDGLPGGAVVDAVERFCAMAGAAGAAVVRGATIDGLIAERFADAGHIASLVPGVAAANVDLAAIDDPHELADLDLVVLDGVLGVAENGAVWLPASRLGHRAAPFIAQHVLIVLDPRRIVADMHDAYARIDPAGDGFGLFMAGPSKTADIEQSLVIGAHGPRSLTILLVAGEEA